MTVNFSFKKQHLGFVGRPSECLLAEYGGLYYFTTINKTALQKMRDIEKDDLRNYIMNKLGAAGEKWTVELGGKS